MVAAVGWVVPPESWNISPLTCNVMRSCCAGSRCKGSSAQAAPQVQAWRVVVGRAHIMAPPAASAAHVMLHVVPKSTALHALRHAGYAILHYKGANETLPATKAPQPGSVEPWTLEQEAKIVASSALLEVGLAGRPLAECQSCVLPGV